MPGSGKSTCGVLTAKVMLKNFFDTDLLLQGMQEKKLQDIIDENGIDYFLSTEEKAVLSLNINATVIATGGSVVYSDEAMKHLKKNGCVVYLHLSYKTMCKRINNITTRGVVLKNGSSLKDMYDERLPLYEKYADVIADVSGCQIEKAIDKIKNLLKACAKLYEE